MELFRTMNPREKARKVFQQQAIAIQNMKDPIWPIADAIWEARDQAIDEVIDVCRKVMGDEVARDCIREIMYLKGKITF